MLIGRFQPYHKGHAALLAQALLHAQHCIIVLGSAECPPSPKNPWDWQTRAQMIRQSLTPAEEARVHFAPVKDYNDLPRWLKDVYQSVQTLIAAHSANPPQHIYLVGHEKDSSSYYLHDFPDWSLLSLPRAGQIDATPIRQALFAAPNLLAAEKALLHFSDVLSPAVIQTLQNWLHTPAYTTLRQAWQDAPPTK